MLRILRIVLSVLFVAAAVMIDITWIASRDAMVIPGVIVGSVATLLLLAGVYMLWGIILYALLVLVNVFMTLVSVGLFGDPVDGMAALVRWQWAWAALGLALLIVVPLRNRQRNAAKWAVLSVQRAQEKREATATAIAAQRKKEVEYAEEVARIKLSAERASTPGEMTGFEPRVLDAIVLERHEQMFGVPGAGLSGSGFDAGSVKRGQQGELNFAKALQKEGFHEHFASFWSVHMPDSEIGASEVFRGDVDCVLVSGSTLWLLDMKNYRQGGVVWKVDSTSGAKPVLYALDRETGGYVGRRDRDMSENMRMATDRFSARLRSSGLPYTVRPVVVMMPQDDGLGTIEDIFYPGHVPAVGLPVLLDWLRAEEPFDPAGDGADVLTRMLDALLKEESGSAVIPDGAGGRDALEAEYEEVQARRIREEFSG